MSHRTGPGGSPSSPLEPETPAQESDTRESLGGIVRSSIVVGSGSLVVIFAGAAKAKVLAVLLGPQGVGLLGILQSLLTTTTAITGEGLGKGSVQQVAAARGREDLRRLSVLRRTMLVAGLGFGAVGAAVLIGFRQPIAQHVLSDTTLSWAVAVLGVGVIVSNISTMQISWVNGFRRIGDLARISIGSSLAAAAIAVVAVAWLKNDASVVIAVLALPAANLLTTWWFSHAVPTPRYDSRWRDVLPALRDIVVPSLALTATVAAGSLTALLARWLVSRELGLGSVGLFQAAWSVAGLYLGFVMNAMAADYYPRLSEVWDKNTRVVQLVNEQAYAALLMTGPVILAMFVAAPIAMRVLYSAEFSASADILRWQLLGDFFRVPAWTMSFVLLAQRRGLAYFLTQMAWNVVYLAAILVGLRSIGVLATGVAALVSFAVSFFLIYPMLRVGIGFRWTRANLRLMAINCTAAVLVVAAQGRFPFYWAVQLLVTGALFVFCARMMRRSLGGWRALLRSRGAK